MVAVGMMQSSIHEVIDMIAVRYGVVPTRWAMGMWTARFWRALLGIGRTDRDDVLINMIIVHVMEMAIMQIVDVTLMAYCLMPAIGTVPVRMVRMMVLVASGHLDFPFFLAGCRRLRVSAARSMALSTKRTTWVSKSEQ
jgi:hypothetical protein